MLSKKLFANLRVCSTGVAVGAVLSLGYSTSAVPTSAAPVAGAAKAQAVDLKPPADGRMDFVVSSVTWALGPDADKSTACPNGMTMTAREAYQATLEGRRRDGESDQDYNRRVAAAVPPPARDLPNACAFPEERGPDPYYRTVVGSNLPTPGMNLDGVDSSSKGRAAPGTCAHEDFVGVNGQRGVDNQFYRLVGCSKGFQSTGGHIGFEREMLTGAWGILISLQGVDSLINDKEVEVGIYANADPIQLSAGRQPLSYATYNPDPNSRFRGNTRGRIVNGVLETDPVDVRFHWTVASMWLERPMRRARLRVTIRPDGTLDGLLGGYTDVDSFYDFLVGYRNAKDEKGALVPQRTSRAQGSSTSAGLTCNGIYHAMKQLADGDRDPKTGKCSSLSNQYRIQAVPAFVRERPTVTASAK